MTALLDRLLAHEEGDLSDIQTLELFADLIATGYAWTLQGSYGRTAASFIEGGLITADGDITGYGADLAEEGERFYASGAGESDD